MLWFWLVVRFITNIAVTVIHFVVVWKAFGQSIKAGIWTLVGFG